MKAKVLLMTAIATIISIGCSVAHSRIPIPKDAFDSHYGQMFDAAIVSAATMRYHPVQQDSRLGIIKLVKESSGGATARGTTYTINITFSNGDDGGPTGVEIAGDASGPVDNPLTLMNPIIGPDTEKLKQAIMNAAHN